MPAPAPASFRRSVSEPAVPARPRSSSRTSSTLSSTVNGERRRKHTRSARYEKGHTDSGLHVRSIALSPGRESVHSGGTSASSVRSLLAKIQSWSTSCFSKGKDDDAGPTAKTPYMLPLGGGRSQVVQPEPKPLRERAALSATVRRPLRERNPEPMMAAVGFARPMMPVVTAEDARLHASTSGVKEKDQYVWAHKHRPRFLKEFICNRDLAEKLLQMAIEKQFSHYIFEGPPGAGKKTMVLAFLRDNFGPEKLKIKSELKKIELKGELVTSININVRISSQLVEVNLSESRGYEKHVIVALINEFMVPPNEIRHSDHTNCRVIVLHEADRLSTDTQHYVRWLMEKYEGGNKIFFCCSDSSKLHPLKNLCKIIKLQPPSDKEIIEVLELIAKKEHIDLPYGLAKRVAEKSNHNLRQAIRSFEASWKLNYPFEENQEILTGWEEDIANIARKIVEEQSPKQLYIIHGKLKNLIEQNVSADFIFKSLIAELKKHVDDNFKAKIDAMYQEYKIWNNGHSLNNEKIRAFSCGEQADSHSNLHDANNVHHFMRIEEFTAKFMSYYKMKTGGATHEN